MSTQNFEESITYRDDVVPSAHAIARLYAMAPLRRPIHDISRLGKMVAGSNVVLTAWDGERLVGILRGFTDGAYDGTVCDLAVHPDVQKAGVGRRLLENARAIDAGIQWMLLASPLAKDDDAHLGWQRAETGGISRRRGWNPGSYDEFLAENAALRGGRPLTRSRASPRPRDPAR